MTIPGNDLLTEVENAGGVFAKLGVYIRNYLSPAIQQRGLPGHVYATPTNKPGPSSLQALSTLVANTNPKSASYVGTDVSGNLITAAQPAVGITALTGDVAASGAGSVSATVQGIQTIPVAATAPAAGDGLVYNGTSYTPDAVAIDPTTTEGDLIVRGPSGLERLPAAAAGAVLTANGAGALPSYQTQTDVSGRHFYGTGGAPTVAAGSGTGSGSASLQSGSTDAVGSVTLTTGATPSTGAQLLFTLTFAVAYSSDVLVHLTPTGASESIGELSSALGVFLIPSGGTSFAVYSSGTVNLAANQQYQWNYLVFGL